MKNLKNEASAVVSACDSFLESNAGVTPRIAERNMQPLFDALVAVMKAEREERHNIPLISYDVGEGGVRTSPGETAVLTVVVTLDREKKMWRIPHIFLETPQGIMLAPLFDQAREVNLDDLVEVGVSPKEIAASVRKLAVALRDRVEVNVFTKPASA